MVSETERQIIRTALENVDALRDVDISGSRDPYCVISFTTTFSRDSAYDLELDPTGAGYKAILLSSAETPLMQESIESFTSEELISLFDHVVETLRELEGN